MISGAQTTDRPIHRNEAIAKKVFTVAKKEAKMSVRGDVWEFGVSEVGSARR